MKITELEEELMEDVPSARWVTINAGSTWSESYKCSRCGSKSKEKTNFCAVCGAKMIAPSTPQDGRR